MHVLTTGGRYAPLDNGRDNRLAREWVRKNTSEYGWTHCANGWSRVLLDGHGQATADETIVGAAVATAGTRR